MLKELLLNKFNESYKEYDYIDKESLFLRKAVNIIYGDKAVGKTTSVIKALNTSGIEPIVLDYDNNPRIDDCKYINIKGSKDVIDTIIEHKEADSEVIVIDHLDGLSQGRYMSEEDATKVINLLKELSELHTIILLAHATILRSATKSSITFRGNDKIPNNADTVYMLDKKGTLTIEKHRGRSIDPITNWQR